MSPFDRMEWRLPHMRYGPKGTRAYARKPYRDADGNPVLPTYADPEEKFREFPLPSPRESTVGRLVLMPHFQRRAEERRLMQGHGTFVLAPDAWTPPKEGLGRPKRGRGPPRKLPAVGVLSRERSSEGEPPRKRGRPHKAPSVSAEPSRVITRPCQCEDLFQIVQGDQSVAEYTKEFLSKAKKCKPKAAEVWCKWYKKGLCADIRSKMVSVLEPLEFALVMRMAGLAIEAEEKIAAILVDISSAEEEEEDPSEDFQTDDGDPEAAASGSRAVGSGSEADRVSPRHSG
ncbi:hypothetical protein N665_0387s0003 [Sinapis alba]|nr:hypothetical protein N665_0387s0003 [Sinapis alba]